MKTPAFQFYPKDFLSSPDVQMMDAKEVGAYCLLLFNAWEATERPGYLPNDERKLQRWARLSKEDWLEAREILLEKFPVSECGQFRYNRRLVAEAAKQEVRRERLAENGRKGGRPSKNQEETNSKAKDNLQVSSENLQGPKTKADERLPFASASSTSSTTAVDKKKEETPSPLRSEVAAPAEDLESARIVPAQEWEEVTAPKSSSASAPHTEGGAVDVATQVAKRFTPPTYDEMLAYMQQQRPHNSPADVERVAAKCFGYYSGNGWKVGRNPMKDWKGACQTFLADLPKLTAPAAGELTVYRNPANPVFTSQPQQSQVAARTQQAHNMMNAYDYDENGNRLGRRIS